MKITPVLPTSPERQLDYQVAEAVFGWKWKSFIGIPVRGTPGYPEKCRVMQFFSPKTLADSDWQRHLNSQQVQDVTQEDFETLPLSYRYCSSQGPEYVPQYSTVDDIDVLSHIRKHWDRGSDQWKSFRKALPPAADYEPGDYSRAALKALEENEALATGEGE